MITKLGNEFILDELSSWNEFDLQELSELEKTAGIFDSTVRLIGRGMSNIGERAVKAGRSITSGNSAIQRLFNDSKNYITNSGFGKWVGQGTDAVRNSGFGKWVGHGADMVRNSGFGKWVGQGISSLGKTAPGQFIQRGFGQNLRNIGKTIYTTGKDLSRVPKTGGTKAGSSISQWWNKANAADRAWYKRPKTYLYGAGGIATVGMGASALADGAGATQANNIGYPPQGPVYNIR